MIISKAVIAGDMNKLWEKKLQRQRLSQSRVKAHSAILSIIVFASRCSSQDLVRQDLPYSGESFC